MSDNNNFNNDRSRPTTLSGMINSRSSQSKSSEYKNHRPTQIRISQQEKKQNQQKNGYLKHPFNNKIVSNNQNDYENQNKLNNKNNNKSNEEIYDQEFNPDEDEISQNEFQQFPRNNNRVDTLESDNFLMRLSNRDAIRNEKKINNFQ